MNDVAYIEGRCEAYLHWIAGTARLLAAAKRMRDNMRESIDGVKGTSYDKVCFHASATADTFADAVARLEDVDAKMAQAIEEHAEAMDEWRRVQLKMNPSYAAILTEHYVNGDTWEDIAQREGYSERSIYRMRIDALIDLYDVLPQGWQ